MKYSEIVIDHFRHPRNCGELPQADVVGTEGTPGQGAFLCLYLRLEGERVAEATFQTYGCGPAIAAGSLLTELIQGKSLTDCAQITEESLLKALGGLPSGKEFCAGLAVNALRQALQALDSSPSKEGEEVGAERSPCMDSGKGGIGMR